MCNWNENAYGFLHIIEDLSTSYYIHNKQSEMFLFYFFDQIFLGGRGIIKTIGLEDFYTPYNNFISPSTFSELVENEFREILHVHYMFPHNNIAYCMYNIKEDKYVTIFFLDTKKYINLNLNSVYKKNIKNYVISKLRTITISKPEPQPRISEKEVICSIEEAEVENPILKKIIESFEFKPENWLLYKADLLIRN